MEYVYRMSGTCATRVSFEIVEDRMYNLSFENGCSGNLKALSKLAEGMDISRLVACLEGIECGRKHTSCGDQLALAVKKAVAMADGQGLNPSA